MATGTKIRAHRGLSIVPVDLTYLQKNVCHIVLYGYLQLFLYKEMPIRFSHITSILAIIAIIGKKDQNRQFNLMDSDLSS